MCLLFTISAFSQAPEGRKCSLSPLTICSSFWISTLTFLTVFEYNLLAIWFTILMYIPMTFTEQSNQQHSPSLELRPYPSPEEPLTAVDSPYLVPLVHATTHTSVSMENFWAFYRYGIIHYVSFCVWLPLLRKNIFEIHSLIECISIFSFYWGIVFHCMACSGLFFNFPMKVHFNYS